MPKQSPQTSPGPICPCQPLGLNSRLCPERGIFSPLEIQTFTECCFILGLHLTILSSLCTVSYKSHHFCKCPGILCYRLRFLALVCCVLSIWGNAGLPAPHLITGPPPPTPCSPASTPVDSPRPAGRCSCYWPRADSGRAERSARHGLVLPLPTRPRRQKSHPSEASKATRVPPRGSGRATNRGGRGGSWRQLPYMGP